MKSSVPEIKSLSTDINEIEPLECVKYLQQITAVPINSEEAQHLLDHIAAIIQKETAGNVRKELDDDSNEEEQQQHDLQQHRLVNHTVLNLSFRSYYAVVTQHQLPDKHFASLSQKLHREQDFLMLYATLLTPQVVKFDAELLRNSCCLALAKAIESNDAMSLLAIVKTLNLLCRKFPALDVDLSLEHIYYLLQQSHIMGLRDETLTLFNSCAKPATRAQQHFQLVNAWPWTNKNKYYLLSGCLNTHSLSQLLMQQEETKYTDDFFQGLRMGLNYKNLFAASQQLVRALSAQESVALLQLSAQILTHGTRRELANFQAQWFSRITQKDALFLLLQQQLEISDALLLANDAQRYRLIMLFAMFSRQIFALSKLHFFKISTELITNCFQLEPDAQLLVFKFIVDNLSNFAIEDCLEFLLNFLQTHRDVASAQYRNNMLGKIPVIGNYIAKTFSRLPADDASTLRSSISNFFRQLQRLVESDMGSASYQPKIFALRLLELLLKSHYAPKPTKNAKNCSIVQNQRLGDFLIAEGVFDANHMQQRLLALLDDPLGFDDAAALVVSLLQQLQYKQTSVALLLVEQSARQCDVDACALSALYAQVVVQSFASAQQSHKTLELVSYCRAALQERLPAFSADPLLQCRGKGHLFGYLQIINACVGAVPTAELDLVTLLELLRDIAQIVLKMLSLEGGEDGIAASFHDMDASLTLLVRQSAFKFDDDTEDEDNIESSRKFLLMSFWLTLRACCDLGTSIGCQLAISSETDSQHLQLLEQCLQLNVCVLTKCRHKGVIESAGVSIGKLIKCMTTQLPTHAKAYQLLHNCIDALFVCDQQISTTRRGAGLSIMLLHVVKNEEQRARPLLQRAMRNIRKHIKVSVAKTTAENYDSLEALTLHYLCVLVKDTELREPMTKYHDEIMMAAMQQIDHPEWPICNAALQLFGALVPKIVGQKQASEDNAIEETTSATTWEPTEVTYMEIALRLPKTCRYILDYCMASTQNIRSIILFVGFLAKVEHLRKCAEDNESSEHCSALLLRFRELMWSLLAHKAEKVRKLAARCFVRAHEFRCALPQALLATAQLLFRVRNANFHQGLIYVLIEGVHKLRHDATHTMDVQTLQQLLSALQLCLTQGFQLRAGNLYTRCKLLELLLLLGFERDSSLVSQLLTAEQQDTGSSSCIGYDVWQQQLQQII